MQHNFRIKPLALAAVTMILSLPALADDTVLIGLAGPLTGPSARIGKDLENGARLAIADANAQKPTLNGKPVTFKLLSEDDQSDPRTAVAVAQRLVDEGVAGVVGHWNTGTSIPAARIYHDAGIAQVAPVATGHGYTQQGFDTSLKVTGLPFSVGFCALASAIASRAPFSRSLPMRAEGPVSGPARPINTVSSASAGRLRIIVMAASANGLMRMFCCMSYSWCG